MTVTGRTTLTPYFISTLSWVLASPFLYGFHIAALNQVQSALQCFKAVPEDPSFPPYTPPITNGFPVCIPMSNATFGFVTSVFTIGGLLGSLSSTHLMNKYGRKGAVKFNSAFILAGSILMTMAWNAELLIAGRFVIGIGAGVAMCVGPIFLSEIAPQKIKGSVGVLNQLSVVFGLLLAQAIGLAFSTPDTHRWRVVFLTSCVLCLAQLLLSAGVSDTPNWLTAVGRETEADDIASKLWRDHSPGADGEDDGRSTSSRNETTIAPLSVVDLFKMESLRKPVIVVLLAMFGQQISGINAVIFYSNAILSRVMPGAEGYISLGIAILNAIMTFPAVYLIERLGRRSLLLGSMLAVEISLIALALGLNGGVIALSTVAILAFVGSFAIGLGPVPFVLIGELVPFYAASATSSLALSLNWITNFVVGVGFLPLRDWLSSEDPTKPNGRQGEGQIFFLFAGAFGVTALLFAKEYKK
ncbi:hypothetical protein M407DRAFT_76061 [Tulasnella calospora MUT 4182]|uniref:Major facilitator superfamily (MFS) profile domain-containing protein n=1 Tax=Tulasnella calospora MUT 4182 TaxID=1051891 RepID=A0A0C3QFZ4_9AGAM|nr:hypothetical protein M407DRAFT_76061 [Tulasnella calospora MUT 4182]